MSWNRLHKCRLCLLDIPLGVFRVVLRCCSQKRVNHARSSQAMAFNACDVMPHTEFRPLFVPAGSFSMMNIVEYSGDIILLRVRVRPASGWGVNSWLMRSTVDHWSHSYLSTRPTIGVKTCE